MNQRWYQRYLAELTVAFLALAASGIGIVNQFTYDDRYVILFNKSIHSLSGWWRGFGDSYWPKTMGGDGYRPLTILMYKLEWAIGGGTPVVFHAANILLYALAAVLVFRLARKVLPLPAAWLAAAFFAVHPVHVEAVANVVGQSELIVACALLGATVIYLRDRLRGPLRPWSAVAVAVLFLVGCFAKEHGIVLPAVLLVAEATLILDSTALRKRAQTLLPFYLGLAVLAVGFLAIRSHVLSNLTIAGFRPHPAFSALSTSTSDRILTAIGVAPEWARLLFWPARLSSEYSPPDIEIAQGASIAQLPGLLFLIAIVGFAIGLRRRQPVVAFGIGFTCATLLPTSNFILPTGIVLAERTLFLPSAGAMLIVGAVAALIAGELRARASDRLLFTRLAQACAALLIIAGAVRSTMRTPVWRTNDALFDQAVIDAPLSYRAHQMRGVWAFEHKRLRIGEEEFRAALKLFPYDPWIAFALAEEYRKVGNCPAAIPLYRYTRGINPNFPTSRTFLAVCLLETDEFDESKKWSLEAIRAGGDTTLLHRVIFLADSVKAARATKGARAAGLRAKPVASREGSKVPESVQKAARQSLSGPSD